MTFKPVFAGLLCAIVLLFGLGVVLQRALTVAPWAGTAQDGRVVVHMKNVTRFPGDPARVRQQVHRAVFLHEPPPMVVPASWPEVVLADVHPSLGAGHVVVLPGGPDDLAWALPGAYWAAYANAPVVFVERDLPSAAQVALRIVDLPAVVVAPPGVVPDEVMESIREIVPATRVWGSTLARHAVVVAETRLEDIGFGWGRTNARREGYFELALAPVSDPYAGLAALPLATTNGATFLFTSADGGLPAATDRYLWSLRPDWFTTPSEGPFRHAFLLGDTASYATQARIDLALEKSSYPTRGSVGLGPFEAVGVVFVALGLACGLFVYVHAARVLRDAPLAGRIAWALTAALVPILGLALYVGVHRRAQEARSLSTSAAAATAMGFGFGAPLMILLGYLLAWYGLPIGFGPAYDGWEPVLGAGMTRMMAVMYAGAVLLAWPLAQVPMNPALSRWRVLGVTALSMAAVSLGMMTATWVLLMYRLPMMPAEDELAWFVSMWVAAALGFVVAWPLNVPMVRAGLKGGS